MTQPDAARIAEAKRPRSGSFAITAIASVAMVVLGAFAAACGGGSGDQPAPTHTVSRPAAATPTAENDRASSMSVDEYMDEGDRAYNSGNYQDAFDWYQLAAEQGLDRAQSNLGVLYRDGQGVTRDYEKAADLFEQAAEQGDASAQHNLAVLYRDGLGVTRDYEKAADLFEQAAEQGDASAQSALGALYANGRGVPRDYERAAAWFHASATQGDSSAMYNIGVQWFHGKGVSQDYAMAAYWGTRALEADDLDSNRGLRDKAEELISLAEARGREAEFSGDDVLALIIAGAIALAFIDDGSSSSGSSASGHDHAAHEANRDYERQQLKLQQDYNATMQTVFNNAQIAGY